MKRMLTMIAVLGILGLIALPAMAVDTNDYDMPVRCYINNTDTVILPDVNNYHPHAERSGYNKQEGWNESITMGFRNQIWYHPTGNFLSVELSDTLLYWDVGVGSVFGPTGPAFGTDTATILAGCNPSHEGMGVNLRVYSDTESGNGARISFSQAEDVVTTSGPVATFPTYYTLTETADTIPPKDSLIRASDLNSYSITVPNDTSDWKRYLWSALDVGKYSRRATYRDDFYITVQNNLP
ncbi:MAG: hypothetical protein AB1297_08670 [bacterium]